MKEDVEIQNIVASVNLHKELPLREITVNIEGTEYNPEQFPGLVLRLAKGKTALLFSSGKVVCTGGRSRDEVSSIVGMIIDKLKDNGVDISKKPDVEVQNIVSSGNLWDSLDLNNLAFKLENAEYEPEQFPGLVYQMPNSHITFLLFGTGKIVCTGAKNKKEIERAIEKLIKRIEKIEK